MGINNREVNGKLKYRLLNDPSTLVLGPYNKGALNDQLNKRDTSEVPTVFIRNCNDRIWNRIYNLRVANPTLRIIIYKDELVKAFRCICYHPDIATAYSYVFRNYLVVPIRAIFEPSGRRFNLKARVPFKIGRGLPSSEVAGMDARSTGVQVF